LIKGFFKGTKRVLSCHPIKFLGGGEGFEPVKKNKNYFFCYDKNQLTKKYICF